MMAMVMPDESRPRSMPDAEQARLVAPSIWAYEVANALRNAVRRGRLAPDHAATLSRRLEDYEVSVERADASVHQRYIAAATHDMTSYDAAYLDLALQRRFGLATLDLNLARGAQRLGLVVLD
jgi:predicted nucleic acid-binding protein